MLLVLDTRIVQCLFLQLGFLKATVFHEKDESFLVMCWLMIGSAKYLEAVHTNKTGISDEMFWQKKTLVAIAVWLWHASYLHGKSHL